jgi:hypothetical protein
MIAHSSGVELAGLEQDAVGDADLADVVQRARVASSSASARQPEREREPLAQAADALDVLAGVAVARLGGLAEAADDLELGLAQLRGALAHALLEHLVVGRDAAALAALGT